MNALWQILLPELQQFPASEQEKALDAARAAPLDLIELLGMAAGMVAVTALTRYSRAADGADFSSLWAIALNLFLALPLLAIFMGPFHLRRLRRGLREQRHEPASR